MLLFLLTKPIGTRQSDGGHKAEYRATRRMTVLLLPGETFVLHGRDDLTYLHCAPEGDSTSKRAGFRAPPSKVRQTRLRQNERASGPPCGAVKTRGLGSPPP